MWVRTTSAIAGGVARVEPRVQARPAARALALAHYIEEALDAKTYGSAAEVAEVLGVTKAPISQVAALLRLSPEVQEGILCGDRGASIRRLRLDGQRRIWPARRCGGPPRRSASRT